MICAVYLGLLCDVIPYGRRKVIVALLDLSEEVTQGWFVIERALSAKKNVQDHTSYGNKDTTRDH